MMKTLLLNILLLSSLYCVAQYPATRQNGALVREERYVTNSPSNGIGTSVRIEYTKDSTLFMMEYRDVGISRLSGTRNDIGYTNFLWTDINGIVKRSTLPSWLLQSQTDLLYKSISYVPSWTEITGKPSLFPSNIANISGLQSALDGKQAVGSYLTSETDPVWNGVSSNYRTKVQNDALYYPLVGNPSSFLTSFTELDPTVPAYAKGLNAFSVIKASADVLYKGIGYTPSSGEISSALGYVPYNGTINPNGYISSVPAQSFASLTGKPTTLSGYGITDAYPLSGNPSGFLTSINSGQVTGALGFTPITNTRTITINGTSQDLSANRTWNVGDLLSSGSYANPSWITSLAWSKITGVPSLGTVTSVGITSSDLSISGSPVTTSGNITANLNNTGVTAGSYGSVTVDAKGRVTAGKRLLAYRGTTDASGNYTVTFGTAFPSAPNIQASINNQTSTNQFIRVSNVTTTGFTINVYQRNSINLLGAEILLAAIVNVSGASVDVLVTEM